MCIAKYEDKMLAREFIESLGIDESLLAWAILFKEAPSLSKTVRFSDTVLEMVFRELLTGNAEECLKSAARKNHFSAEWRESLVALLRKIKQYEVVAVPAE